MRLFAWELFAIFSQSRLGPLEFCEVMISTVVKFRLDRHEFSVDPRSDHLVADRTVDGVSKVDGTGADRKRFDIARRAETVNIVGKQVEIAL